MDNKDLAIFKDYLKPLFTSEDVQKMKKFIQHGNKSTFLHALHVSYISFILIRKYNLPLDESSVARGAFLHDLYLYDWHVKDVHRKRFHGFHHPRTAYDNAKRLFKLNDVEKDIILKHMWPLTLKFPKYRESYFVNLVDKIISLKETVVTEEESIKLREWYMDTDGE